MDCAVPNCGKPRNGNHQYCAMHWSRLYRTGDVHADIPPQAKPSGFYRRDVHLSSLMPPSAERIEAIRRFEAAQRRKRVGSA